MLSVSGLCLDLPDRSTLFKDLGFSLRAGETLCVRGPSGCGKTTLLKAIAQLQPYKSGLVALDGRTPSDLGIPCWRASVLYVPQRPPVMPGTPNQFLDKIRQYKAQKARAPFADPADIALGWNLPLDTWDKPWNLISGGEIQRTALAIAISQKPTVLLLDEPTSALDQETSLLVEQSLSALTCVMVTHSAEQEQRVATRTLTLPGRNHSNGGGV
ncbi:hypothetical protein SmJEL517_g00608 [Synchytrium microbalum]|uniref:ABC transporter domain-containing protein n=1 Tax=Synchytrium microbalum TaxID=1806994 RepID=A0A507C829_9FUNG|nr:uncharacterized protein SmJEL517_g00608 [Synchytrium microbalum]TPX37740.1 hypothetical protein SmJEL517_g00608 [Synchytrium microbalum]